MRAPAGLITQPSINLIPPSPLTAWDPICQRATDPCSFLTVNLAECNAYPQNHVLGKPQLCPGSRNMSDVCDCGYPAPWLDAEMGPGYQAPALPSWGPFASLWSCQPVQSHDNLNAKTFQGKLGIPIFHNKQTKYITIK